MVKVLSTCKQSQQGGSCLPPPILKQIANKQIAKPWQKEGGRAGAGYASAKRGKWLREQATKYWPSSSSRLGHWLGVTAMAKAKLCFSWHPGKTACGGCASGNRLQAAAADSAGVRQHCSRQATQEPLLLYLSYF